jgi:hypothetical protein
VLVALVSDLKKLPSSRYTSPTNFILSLLDCFWTAWNLQKQREELGRAYTLFQEYYVSDRDRQALRQVLSSVWTRYGEKGRILLEALEVLLKARSAYAHSAIFMKIEVSSFANGVLCHDQSLLLFFSCTLAIQDQLGTRSIDSFRELATAFTESHQRFEHEIACLFAMLLPRRASSCSFIVMCDFLST